MDLAVMLHPSNREGFRGSERGLGGTSVCEGNQIQL